METRPQTTYWYESIAWLIREAPSILGERSIQGAVESALRSGGPGHSVASSSDHHDHLIEKLRLDCPPGQSNEVAKWRTLNAIWMELPPTSCFVLDAYYTPRVCWPSGFDAFIGTELASVALAFPPDGDAAALREACTHDSKNKKLILRARERAATLIREAHEDWDAARGPQRITLTPKDRITAFRRSLA